MSILLIGSEGSMGRRYQAILKYLGQDVTCTDKECPESSLLSYAERSQGIIIATPTDTHGEIIRKVIEFKKPILCEKPISRDLKELRELGWLIKAHHARFEMMFQYQHLIFNDFARGPSSYDYFRHGNDGLYWDCLQIIGLAKDMVSLKQESPIWSCMINGQDLKIQCMDTAYLVSVRNWLKGYKSPSFSELLEIHQKVKEMESAYA